MKIFHFPAPPALLFPDTHLDPVFDLLVANLVEQEEVQLLLKLLLGEDPPLIEVTGVRPVSQSELHFLCGRGN